MNLYLVVLGFGFDREAVVKYVAAQPGMGTWFYSMPYSFFIQTSLSAQALSDLIKAKYAKNDLRHFVTRVSGPDHQGWMPESHWTKFNKVIR